MNTKPGFKTTEFWATILNAMLMVLVAFGVVNQDEAAGWEKLIVPVLGAVVPLIVYSFGRVNLKANGS